MNKITLGFFRTKSKITIKGLLVLFALFLMNTQVSWGQSYYSMSSGNYSQSFTGLSTAYPTNFNGLAILGTGSIPVATKTTTATNSTLAVVGSGTAIGYDAITANSTKMILLSTGATDNSTAVACDLNLDFAGRNAGNLSFNYANILNSAGAVGRASSLIVYYSVDGTTWASLGGPYTVYNTTGASTANVPVSIALPAALNNQSTVKFRFYHYNGGTVVGSPTGSRPKISLDDIVVTSTSSGTASPTLSADTSSNTVDNPIDITFTDDSDWRGLAVVKIGTTTLLSGTDYDLTAGNLQLKPSGLNPLLTTAGSKSIVIEATGYTNATVTQTINAGAPTANSTATISAALAPNFTRTITCTAKDQYNNLVSGYKFKYDVTIANNNSTTTEVYNINGAEFIATSTTGNPAMASTNVSGVATIDAATPVTIDSSDGVSIQIQLNDDTTNIGTAFSFTQLASQTITFDALTPVTYGDATFGLTATASSTLPVTYTSSNTDVAEVLGSTVTIVGAGSTNITASQAGNGSFNAATNVIQALTVNAKALTLTGAAAANRAYNTLFTTDITGALTGIINSDDVTLVGTLKGTFADANVADGIAVSSACTLTGTKAGNYTLTQPTGLTANITQASQTITFAALANKTTVELPFSLLATASSGLSVTYVSSNTAVATISGSTVTIVGGGSTTITASQVGDSNYASASPIDQVLSVNAVVYLNQFTGISACPTNGNVPLVSTNVSGTPLTRNTITCTTLANQFNSTTLNNTSIVNDASYIEFSTTAVSGYRLNLTSLSFYRQGSSTAPNSLEVRYSTDGFITSTSWGAAPVTPASGTVATWNFDDFSSENAGTVTFRIYPYGTQRTDLEASPAAASTGTFRLDDVTVNGNVTAVTTWNGTAWSNGTPSATIEAIIDGAYLTKPVIDGGNGLFSAKKLTVTSIGSLTVNEGTNLTVVNEVINNAGATGIVIENNANLIQDAATVVNANTGAVTVNRNSNPLFRLDYTLWSSPVTGAQTLLNFSPLTVATRFYDYDTNLNLYTAVPDPSTTPFVAGKGNLIRMPDTGSANYVAGTETLTYNGTFTGVPNNGNVQVVLSGFNAKYNLVGNPYPSTINADAFIDHNEPSVIESTIYFWRKKNNPLDTSTAYATYNLVGGVGAGSGVAGAGSEVPNGTIQVGQGFFVQAKFATTAGNFFTNAMRLPSSSTQFFKTKKVVNKDRIWLNLTNASGVFSQMLVGYLADATSGLDRYDGKYINDSPIALTSNINNEEYTIQGRPAFDAADVVALNFKTDVAGDYTIAIDHVDGLFSRSQDIYLVDSKTGTETNLKTSSYTFTAAAAVDNTRFSLKFQKTLSLDAQELNDNSVIVYKNGGVIYVNSGAKMMNNIKVFDILGRVVAERNNVKANTTSIQNLRASNQVLIVKVTTDDNQVISKKVEN